MTYLTASAEILRRIDALYRRSDAALPAFRETEEVLADAMLAIGGDIEDLAASLRGFVGLFRSARSYGAQAGPSLVVLLFQDAADNLNRLADEAKACTSDVLRRPWAKDDVATAISDLRLLLEGKKLTAQKRIKKL